MDGKLKSSLLTPIGTPDAAQASRAVLIRGMGMSFIAGNANSCIDQELPHGIGRTE